MTSRQLANLSNMCMSAESRHIRNLCIIAHVDHGKTTLSDFLLASNQHVSERQLLDGTKSQQAVRFLDSREDETIRQITIAASSISLSHSFQGSSHIINLIDSPGHLDFSAEVSAAARLTDGAFLVVDAVEAVRAQTRTVMRQAWADRITPVLVLNKLDKLSQVFADPSEAFLRLRSVIEDVNAFFSQLHEKEKEERLDVDPNTEVEEDPRDKCFEFCPAVAENVVFASALHGWGFTLRQWLDRLLFPKLQKLLPEGTRSEDLLPYLFGNYFLYPPKKQTAEMKKGKLPIGSSPPSASDQPIFVKFVLEQLWKLLESDDATKKLRSLFPLASTCLDSAIRIVPNPAEAFHYRKPHIGGKGAIHADENAVIVHSHALLAPQVEGSVSSWPATEEGGEDQLVFVAKQLPADFSIGCLIGDKIPPGRSIDGFLALSRVFRGTIKQGDVLFFKQNRVTIAQIFCLLGNALLPISSAAPGMVVGLRFAEKGRYTGATLSSSSESRPFRSPFQEQQAIVRVCIETSKLSDMELLDEGLDRLMLADPAVCVDRNADTGERVVGCCGDEHLSRCLQDLKQLYAPDIALVVSPPIVDLRETVVLPQRQETHLSASLPSWLKGFQEDLKDLDGKGAWGAEVAVPPSKELSVKIRAWPLGEENIEILEKDGLLNVKKLDFGSSDVRLLGCCTARATCNILTSSPDVFSRLGLGEEGSALLRSLVHGFERASLSGPLCHEPVRGVNWELTDICGDLEAYKASNESLWALTGATFEACRASMLVQGLPRVSEPMLLLELQCEHVRNVTAMLKQRRAEIFFSDICEGNYSEHVISALLPASEAFGTFADELRSAARGKIIWKLSFGRWRVLRSSNQEAQEGSAFLEKVSLEKDQNPLVEFARTAAEIEDFGAASSLQTQGGGGGNVARRLVQSLRKRKGLQADELVIFAAEKQRNMTKMK